MLFVIPLKPPQEKGRLMCGGVVAAVKFRTAVTPTGSKVRRGTDWRSAAMLVFKAYGGVWPLCVGLMVFLALLCAAARFCPVPWGERRLGARRVFWVSMVLWLVFMSAVTTLIDSPYLPVSQEAITWMFMLSAFLGLPLSMPPFAVAVWAFFAAVRGERVRLATVALLGLGAFALGAATSNMHDVLWCGIITKGYSVPYPAGGDLAFFYAVAGLFPLPAKVCEDYAVFGACMIIMVIGELALAAVCLRRLRALEAHSHKA